MNYSLSDVLSAFDHFERNWGELQRSQIAACSMCLYEFVPKAVQALYRFEDGIAYEQPLADAIDSDTARCPKCGLAYVIGDAELPIAAEGYLNAAHKHWHT